MDKKQNRTNNLESFLIDSSILVSTFSQKESKERRAIAARVIGQGVGKASITQQNIVEFTNTMLYSLKSQNPKAILEIINDLQSVFKIFQYSKEGVAQALELAIDYKIDFNDALIAQTMLDNKIAVIYTENTKNFAKVPGIKAINPFTVKRLKSSRIGVPVRSKKK